MVPILKDRAAFHSLSFSAAARYSDSSLFDSDTGTKFSLNWGPTETDAARELLRRIPRAEYR